MARLLIFAVRVYQGFVSPLVPSACKFYPSCSHYAAEAIARWGVRHGAWLAVKRVLRCRPFSPGGYDPVPDETTEMNTGAALTTQERAQ